MVARAAASGGSPRVPLGRGYRLSPAALPPPCSAPRGSCPQAPHLGQHSVGGGAQQHADDPLGAASRGDALCHHEQHCEGTGEAAAGGVRWLQEMRQAGAAASGRGSAVAGRRRGGGAAALPCRRRRRTHDSHQAAGGEAGERVLDRDDLLGRGRERAPWRVGGGGARASGDRQHGGMHAEPACPALPQQGPRRPCDRHTLKMTHSARTMFITRSAAGGGATGWDGREWWGGMVGGGPPGVAPGLLHRWIRRHSQLQRQWCPPPPPTSHDVQHHENKAKGDEGQGQPALQASGRQAVGGCGTAAGTCQRRRPPPSIGTCWRRRRVPVPPAPPAS